MNNLMVSVIDSKGRIDTPEGLDVWHYDIFEARKEGVRFCQDKDFPYFVVRRITNGHYKTLCYRDKNGNKIQ